MSDDPFAEPDDADRTVIKPNPGGRRTIPQTPPQSASPARPQPAAGPQEEAGFGVPKSAPQEGGSTAETAVEQGMTGMNRLNAAASTLFSLVSRIRNRAQHMDPEKLRRSVIAEVRAFENLALQSGVDAQDVKIARYAICATIDDVVLNTPWGGHSVWAQQSMVGTFHKETVGGDRLYDLLARLEKDPAKNIDLLEFLYLCLSLGFEGRLRVEANGSEKHMQIRQGLARIIRGQRGLVERDLSPHWVGAEVPHKVLSIWKPVWIMSAIVAVFLSGSFMTLSYLLQQSTGRVLGQLSALDSGQVAVLLRRAPPPPPPSPPPVEHVSRISGFLQEEIEQNLVEIFQDNSTITVRIAGAGMFGSGSDTVKPAYDQILTRVAEALNGEPGKVIIVGHSDNVPIRSSRFPSNMHLSLARAESVMRAIAPQLDDQSRISAEGRADKEPIVPNETAEGRAKNRRIEVVLVKEDAT
ncbi:type VI secretion system protein TssL, long form [Ostreiculturibacter nitratireducens]|uniref:type VI secretion system protein TssL, long form n=1 Tax=Ostreiculturibacter nitratireducens TaxID=3075226 RepID=UPI0031B62159